MTRTILFSLAFTVGFFATAANANLPQMIEIEDVYEVGSRDVRLPSESVGNLILKQCSACETVVLRVNAKSRAFIDDEEVSFRELQQTAARVDTVVYVFFSPEEKVVTRVVLDK